MESEISVRERSDGVSSRSVRATLSKEVRTDLEARTVDLNGLHLEVDTLSEGDTHVSQTCGGGRAERDRPIVAEASSSPRKSSLVNRRRRDDFPTAELPMRRSFKLGVVVVMSARCGGGR